jgi:hypothetical protein
MRSSHEIEALVMMMMMMMTTTTETKLVFEGEGNSSCFRRQVSDDQK